MRREPRQSAPRKQLGSGTTMRYLAKLDDAVPEDQDRTFVVQYYTVDNTVMIREPPRRNSGTVGGKFLARMPLKDEQGAPVSKSEFFVGARLTLAGHAFVIVDTDDGTLKLMEADTDAFPYSCYASVVAAVAGRLDPASACRRDSVAARSSRSACRSRRRSDRAHARRRRQGCPSRCSPRPSLREGPSVEPSSVGGARERVARPRARARVRYGPGSMGLDRGCGAGGVLLVAGGGRRRQHTRPARAATTGGGAVSLVRRGRTGRVGL